MTKTLSCPGWTPPKAGMLPNMVEELWRQLTVASVYMGIVVGAGFASGQEVLRFFSVFGMRGFWGLLLAGLFFALLGWSVLQIGHEQQARSHRPVVFAALGHTAGRIMDLFITLTLFGVFTFMAAGAGAVFEQQYGLSAWLGSLLLIVLTVATILLGFGSVIRSIGIFAPVLLLAVLVISFQSLLRHSDFSAPLDLRTAVQPPIAYWPLSSLIYVSFNFVLAVAVLAPLGRGSQTHATRIGGAVLGGAALFLAALGIHLALLAHLPTSAQVDVPMLAIAETISPATGTFYGWIILAEVYTSAVGSLYGFTARITDSLGVPFGATALWSGLLALAVSRLGFTTLVETLLPFTGLLGLFLVGGLSFWFLRRTSRNLMRYDYGAFRQFISYRSRRKS